MLLKEGLLGKSRLLLEMKCLLGLAERDDFEESKANASVARTDKHQCAIFCLENIHTLQPISEKKSVKWTENFDYAKTMEYFEKGLKF